MNNTTPHRSFGFTLLELLAAIAVLAILVALAAPNFDDTIKKNRVQATQRDLVKDLSFARSTAVSRNTYVAVCTSSDEQTCGGADDWSDGWIVFVDDDRSGTIGDGVRSASEEIIRTQKTGRFNDMTAIGNGQSIRSLNFSSRGYLYELYDGAGDSTTLTRTSFIVCPADDDERAARAVYLEVTGRVTESRDSDGSGIHEVPAEAAAANGSIAMVDISC